MSRKCFDWKKYILCDKDDADIAMMTAYRKHIAHKTNGIRIVQQVIQFEYSRLTPRVFKIRWRAFVITYFQI